MSWHIDGPLVAAYAAGQLPPATEAAVETHMAACSTCQQVAAAQSRPELVEATWQAVSMQIAEPRLPRWAKALRVIGMPEDELALLASGAALRMSWAAAIGTALLGLIASGFTLPSYQVAVFLFFAPLVPVAAVLAAYDATDALRELTDATPYSKLRLALLRTSVALAAAVPLTFAVGLLAPELEALSAAWLLPGLGLTVGALLLLTWLSPEAAGSSVGVGWAATVVMLHSADRIDQMGTANAQVGFAAATLVLAAVFASRTSAATIRGARP